LDLGYFSIEYFFLFKFIFGFKKVDSATQVYKYKEMWNIQLFIALKSSSRFAGTNNRTTVHTIPVIHGLVFLIKSIFWRKLDFK